MAAKINDCFESVDGPLPIHWTPLAEPPRKKPKHGTSKTDSDSEQENEASMPIAETSIPFIWA